MKSKYNYIILYYIILYQIINNNIIIYGTTRHTYVMLYYDQNHNKSIFTKNHQKNNDQIYDFLLRKNAISLNKR